jgi:hypothetical protein
MTIYKDRPVINSSNTAPEDEHLKGEVIVEMALDADGQPIADEPETWAAADAAEPQPVSMGLVKFRVLDPDARELAEMLGAIDPAHPDGAKLLAELHSDEPDDALTMGQFVSIEASDGVRITFLVWCSTYDRDAPIPPEFDLGEGAQRNKAWGSLGARQVLLIQVFGEAGEGLAQ